MWWKQKKTASPSITTVDGKLVSPKKNYFEEFRTAFNKGRPPKAEDCLQILSLDHAKICELEPESKTLFAKPFTQKEIAERVKDKAIEDEFYLDVKRVYDLEVNQRFLQSESSDPPYREEVDKSLSKIFQNELMLDFVKAYLCQSSSLLNSGIESVYKLLLKFNLQPRKVIRKINFKRISENSWQIHDFNTFEKFTTTTAFETFLPQPSNEQANFVANNIYIVNLTADNTFTIQQQCDVYLNTTAHSQVKKPFDDLIKQNKNNKTRRLQTLITNNFPSNFAKGIDKLPSEFINKIIMLLDNNAVLKNVKLTLPNDESKSAAVLLTMLALGKNSQLETLKLVYNDLTAQQIGILFTFLAANKTLKILDLTANEINKQSVENLSLNLNKNQNVKVILNKGKINNEVEKMLTDNQTANSKIIINLSPDSSEKSEESKDEHVTLGL